MRLIAPHQPWQHWNHNASLLPQPGIIRIFTQANSRPINWIAPPSCHFYLGCLIYKERRLRFATSILNISHTRYISVNSTIMNHGVMNTEDTKTVRQSSSFHVEEGQPSHGNGKNSVSLQCSPFLTIEQLSRSLYFINHHASQAKHVGKVSVNIITQSSCNAVLEKFLSSSHLFNFVFDMVSLSWPETTTERNDNSGCLFYFRNIQKNWMQTEWHRN